jgi:23S rRNA-/tRNA-specific pseudouridylate synthase
VYPGDIVGFQQRARSDYNSILGTPYRPPPFKIEVVYEDDHMAIVNKPAGIVVYRAEGGRGGGARGGHGRDTLLSALPYVLKPSKFTNDSEEVPLERPQPVHRLDRPTSGLTVVAKTKAAAVRLAQQFEFRKARKTYCAIVNGVPIAGDSEDTFSEWRTVDYDLDGKSAITSWRQIRRVQSLHGRDGQLTLVELKPKTGRYHQLRRHMVRMHFYMPIYMKYLTWQVSSSSFVPGLGVQESHCGRHDIRRRKRISVALSRARTVLMCKCHRSGASTL